jgi:hypothetical protein
MQLGFQQGELVLDLLELLPPNLAFPAPAAQHFAPVALHGTVHFPQCPNISGNAVRRARKLSQASGKTEHVYDEVGYAAQTWPEQRRVIIKGEVVRAEGKEPKDNPRFIITNMKQTPQWIYEHVYCQRGEIENRIKELHDLQIDRKRQSNRVLGRARVSC